MWNGQMSLKGPTSTMHGPTLLVLINELDAFNLPLTCYTWPLGKYSLGCVVVFLSEKSMNFHFLYFSSCCCSIICSYQKVSCI